MERFALIPLVIILLLSPFYKARAASFYVGPSYSFGGVIAESDFYNGASGWNPSFYLGTRFERSAIELFFKRFTLSNEHDASGATFDLEVTDLMFGMGLRLELVSGVDLLMGFANQSVSTEYTSSDPSKELSPLLEANYFSWYVGTGFRGELYPNYIVRLDMSYVNGSAEYSMLTIDFSIVYRFSP